LAHAVVAQAHGLPVREITLFALGGVSQIEREPADAKTEFLMAIVGPITSFVIGFICLALASALGWTPLTVPATPLHAMLMWLGFINIGLGIFNLIPGFPLDGGRVLRAAVWWVTGDANRSTRIAAGAGRLVAFSFIILGLVRFFYGGNIGGLWISFIGWFLLDAARASSEQAGIEESLRGVRVSDVMARECPVVDGRANLQTFVDDHMLRTGLTCFVVVENSQVVGVITPHEVKAVERRRWPYTTVDQVMRPLDQLRTTTPETPVTEALGIMGRERVSALPVISNERIEGFVSLHRVLQILHARGELRA
jgi:Zn-dependent protease/predicted transcriptional regulator